jgi:hypothetical protein
MELHHPTLIETAKRKATYEKTLTMEILTYVALGMVPLVLMGLTSSIREPALQRFMVL